MKKADYKGKNMKDLHKALADKRGDLRNFRFGAAGSKTRNTKTGKNTRKDIARIMTEINRQEKEASLAKEK